MKRVIAAVDFSDTANTAVAQAVAACRQTGAELVLLYAANLAGAQPDAYEVSQGKLEPFRELLVEEIGRARGQLEEWATRLSDEGVKASARVVDGPPDRAVRTVVDDGGGELVVIGTHGRVGYERIFLGSVAERIVKSCPVDVLIARAPIREAGFERVLAATDFSPEADRALDRGVELSAETAEVHLVHAWRIAGVVGDFIGRITQSSTYAHVAEAVIDSAETHGRTRAQKFSDSGRNVSFTSYGGSATGVIHDRLDAADPPYDLVCVGSHAPDQDDGGLASSVAQGIARFATCSVLIARPPA